MKKAAFYTLGCKVNQYDTEAVLENFRREGYEIASFDDYADVYVVNTCTVTHLSDRKCRQILRKTKKINPESILVAMGCYAQIAPKEIKKQVEEIDLIVGTMHRNQIVDWVEELQFQKKGQTINRVEDIMTETEFEELQISERGEHTRAYLKIQEGCNNYCTYCIIPYVRGKIRSRKPEQVVAEFKRLSQLGYKEIVLTGIHVASYGKDLGNITLLELLKKVHEVDGVNRIRMSSIEPVVVTSEFIQGLKKLPKICHHFHLSLQSGSDTVLKRMNRKYDCKEYLESVHQLRTLWPDVALTTDIIVGFPGETDEEFEETIDFAKEAQLAQIHIFPYSQRKGTVAAKMPNQIAPEVKEKRVKQLAEVERKLRYAFMEKAIGKEEEVLLEKHHEEGYLFGHTSNYLRVEVKGSKELENTIQCVRILKRDGDQLVGEILS